MSSYENEESVMQQHNKGNPWGAFVPRRSLDGYGDAPTDSSTFQSVLTVWKRMFGDRQITLAITDPVPLQQGAVLGSGGLGVVYETHIDGIAVAWKRTYTRRLTDWHLNEVKILGRMTEERHIHIIKLVGSYIHRQRNSTYELAILTWPVARCDLSVLLSDIDLINEWKTRDGAMEKNDISTQPTDEEKTAFDNLLKLEHLERERSTTFTHHLRQRVLNAVFLRLSRSIGCMAEAVKYLHNNSIRHKDIKPSQVLISSDGLWLTDFGWSKDLSQLTSSETSGGDRITMRYHAPERAQMRSCGRAEDIFALGCTFLEMGYRIYGKTAKDYLNPNGRPLWSFQANLDSIGMWLTPFQSEHSNSRSLIGKLIERMLNYEPEYRPTISAVVQTLLTPDPWNYSSFFGACCVPDITDLMLTHASFGHGLAQRKTNMQRARTTPAFDSEGNLTLDTPQPLPNPFPIIQEDHCQDNIWLDCNFIPQPQLNATSPAKDGVCADPPLDQIDFETLHSSRDPMLVVRRHTAPFVNSPLELDDFVVEDAELEREYKMMFSSEPQEQYATDTNDGDSDTSSLSSSRQRRTRSKVDPRISSLFAEHQLALKTSGNENVALIDIR